MPIKPNEQNLRQLNVLIISHVEATVVSKTSVSKLNDYMNSK